MSEPQPNPPKPTIAQNDHKFFEEQAKKRLDEIMESKKIDGEYVCDRNKRFENGETNSAKAVCYNALSILYGLKAMKQQDAFKNILNDKKYRSFLKQILKSYNDDAIIKDFSINMKDLYNDNNREHETFEHDYDGNKFRDLKRIRDKVRNLWFGGKRRRSRKSRTSKRKRTKRAKKSKKRNTRRK